VLPHARQNSSAFVGCNAISGYTGHASIALREEDYLVAEFVGCAAVRGWQVVVFGCIVLRISETRHRRNRVWAFFLGKCADLLEGRVLCITCQLK